MSNYTMHRRKIILKNFIDKLYKNIVPINEGYEFLFADDVYLPVYKSSLLITKRSVLPISLVEEKVLQLLEAEVYEIDEMAKILGLERRLLDITIADLYTKDLIEASANSCRLMSQGIDALRNLSRTEKKQDLLKYVYMDGILGNVLTDISNYQLVDRIYNDNCKLKPIVPINDVTFYTKQYSAISDIFDSEKKVVYSVGISPVDEELLTIDKIDNIYVEFIRIPIYAYHSNNGVDIDIIAAKPKLANLLVTYKDVIIAQIVKKHICKSYFKYRKLNDSYDGVIYPPIGDLSQKLRFLHFSRNKSEIDYTKAVTDILSSRQLNYEEQNEIIPYIAKETKKIELYVYNLDEWAYNPKFVGSLSEYVSKASLSIYYRESNNPDKALQKLKAGCKAIQVCNKIDTDYYICWNFDDKYKIYGLPTQRKVINDNTYSTVLSYYLETLKVFL